MQKAHAEEIRAQVSAPNPAVDGLRDEMGRAKAEAQESQAEVLRLSVANAKLQYDLDAAQVSPPQRLLARAGYLAATRVTIAAPPHISLRGHGPRTSDGFSPRYIHYRDSAPPTASPMGRRRVSARRSFHEKGSSVSSN